MKKNYSILSSLLCIVAIAAVALPGCSNGRSDQNPLAPDGVASLDKGLAISGSEPTSSYDLRLQEIRTLVAERDVTGTVEALDSLFSELSAGVNSGAVSEAQAGEVSGEAQALAAKIDIDVHFGTDEKCSPTFTCVEADQMCVTVTWSVDGTGGGRNCYNFKASGN